MGTEGRRSRGTEGRRSRGTEGRRSRGTEGRRSRGTEGRRSRGTEGRRKGRRQPLQAFIAHYLAALCSHSAHLIHWRLWHCMCRFHCTGCW